MTDNKMAGFTLIELVVVIVILGILAVTAAPKFINISTDTKISTLNGFTGAYKSTESMLEAELTLDGKDINSKDKVTTNDLGIEAQNGSLIPTFENVNRAMDFDGYKVLGFSKALQLIILPSSFSDLSTGDVSLSEFNKGLETNCYVIVQAGTEQRKGTRLIKTYTGC